MHIAQSKMQHNVRRREKKAATVKADSATAGWPGPGSSLMGLPQDHHQILSASSSTCREACAGAEPSFDPCTYQIDLALPGVRPTPSGFHLKEPRSQVCISSTTLGYPRHPCNTGQWSCCSKGTLTNASAILNLICATLNGEM